MHSRSRSNEAMSNRESNMAGFKDGYQPTQDDLDNRSRQLDPEHDAYWQSRGEDSRSQEKEA
ncbi:hypothetical protein VEZ01S_49_00310 [Vibrio ezurae NBRC 102218]|uniref:Uncharacterized protein n=1 Tax=Vibrio ezurae NBRC 102218 TaxID=1219080 RepID=U3CTS6_9VIBR|nr:hypothetical protein VEZ01S_49_00310 [Vibrio ezurae NBRC 102218]